jgi:hypothetical protein
MSCGPAPREQFIEPGDWVACDAREDVCEIGLRIEAVEFAGLDE